MGSAVPTVELVKEALADVRDPSSASDKAMVEAGTLRVLVENDRGRIVVETGANDETRQALERSILAKLGEKGVAFPAGVEVIFRAATGARDITSEDPLPGVKNLVLVMSGKGGVGKSTVAANLACALNRLGAKAGLLDCDIYGPSIPIMTRRGVPPRYLE